MNILIILRFTKNEALDSGGTKGEQQIPLFIFCTKCVVVIPFIPDVRLVRTSRGHT